MTHPALQPVAAVISHLGGDQFHKAGTVRPDDGHNQAFEHARTLVAGTRYAIPLLGWYPAYSSSSTFQ